MDKDALSSEQTGNRRILSVLALSMLLASLGTSIANIALPELAETFSAPFSHVQWVVVAYLATLTVSSVFVGRLGDIYGLRPMHLTGLGLFCGASLLCSLAPNLWLLIGARAIQGIGAAFLMTLTIALVRSHLGEARIGRGMGLLGTMSALGTALGPSLGGTLLAIGSWRDIFLVQVPLAALTLILAWLALPHGSDRTKASPGSIRRVLPWHLLPDLCTNLLVATVMMTTLVVGPFYLGLGLGLDEVAIGLTMSVGPAISIFSGLPSGRAVDTWGAGRVLRFGLALLATGALSLSLLPRMFGVGGYVLAIAILTPGYQLFQAANNTGVMAQVPKDRRGVVSGILGLSRNLGLILGASVMGMVFAMGVGSSDLRQASSLQIEGGMRLVFIVAGAIMVLALGIAFRRPAGNRTG
ncbi:MFS transporter [Phyllobacterium phragmitis]|uniref:MFS transporter n=1 Tax=Phyllobacterium phragmitis TaxID=2670329 RepID=A0A2S9IQ35_9HYPH|nr:MFS transporter [Phyllobacterium phragmitis]PRD42602.1 MFS transporter [Phyllobacterium phragmitis]